MRSSIKKSLSEAEFFTVGKVGAEVNYEITLIRRKPNLQNRMNDDTEYVQVQLMLPANNLNLGLLRLLNI